MATRIDARDLLVGLQGRELRTLTQRKRNVVLDVRSDDVLVSTESAPGGEPVPLSEVQEALDRLVRDGELAATVRGLSSHRSSFIGAALATIPGVQVTSDRPRRLVLRHESQSTVELRHRQTMWQRLHERGGPADVTKRLIRELGLYGGAQGVWVDAERTRAISGDGSGVAVGLLHTGRHYADDLSPTGIIYHYPRTNRPPGRDSAEIAATKKAGALALPVFVVTPSAKSSQRRDVHLGWVVDWDDADEIFLVTFTDDVPPAASVGPSKSFKLLDDDVETRRVEVRARPNQRRFQFKVTARYGGACAVCDIDAPEVLDAIHLAEKGKKGSDHPENGLILCATHHRAFDRGLFCIDPANYAIHVKPHAPDLRMARNTIAHLKAYPHTAALEWRWRTWAHRPSEDKDVRSDTNSRKPQETSL